MAEKKEYIEKAYLLNLCQEMCESKWNKQAPPISWAHAYEGLADDIEIAPVADVVEVVHARWDINGDGDLSVYCTNCLMPQDMPTKYCPGCGAKMDGGYADCRG